MDYNYEYEYDNYYCYPNSYVLRNKLNITDAEELKKAEREITSVRIAQALTNRIRGKFDFVHLKSIHSFIFSDIYEWAGEIRTVNISKGSSFCRSEFIKENLGKLFEELSKEDFLKRSKDKTSIAKRLAYYLGELNAIHSFREGNGRTQRLFIEHLSFSRGYQIDFMNINNDEMLEASIKSFNGDYKMMEDLILKSIKQIKNN